MWTLGWLEWCVFKSVYLIVGKSLTCTTCAKWEQMVRVAAKLRWLNEAAAIFVATAPMVGYGLSAGEK